MINDPDTKNIDWSRNRKIVIQNEDTNLGKFSSQNESDTKKLRLKYKTRKSCKKLRNQLR